MNTKPKNSNRKQPAPDLMTTLNKQKARRLKKTQTADQIADSIETEAKRLQGVADILKGKA